MTTTITVHTHEEFVQLQEQCKATGRTITGWGYGKHNSDMIVDVWIPDQPELLRPIYRVET
jgi:hypothetical protein